ncbi:MAG: hypothetical protein ACJ8E4_10025 [Sphingomicrobium sp.]
MRYIVLLVAAVTVAAAPPAPSDQFSQAIGAALQADEARALQALNGVDLTGLPERDQAAATCMRERFGPGSKPAPPASNSLADRSLALYRDYWHSAMTHPERREAEEQQLTAHLRQLLKAPKGTDLDALEPILAKALEKAGLHSLQGRTGLLRELMIWSKQEERVMRVVLAEGEEEVLVMLLDGFGSLGWGAYATCDRASTGGWATETALFAVVPKYPSLEAEEFRVTFLGHEGQHFADKARFKNLESWELEYRAKLTELAEASATRAKIVGKFISDQGDNPASPHSYANRQVLTNMTQKLGLASAKDLATADPGRVQSAAVELLREDTARRVAASGGR